MKKNTTSKNSCPNGSAQKAKTKTRSREQTKSSSRQRLFQIFLLAAVLLLIVLLWGYRLSKNYVNMFLDHYEGTTSVLSEMKGLEHTEAEETSLLPLQQAFDDWKEQNLRDEVQITVSDGTVLHGGFYDAGSDVTAILFHSFDGNSAESDYLFAPCFAEKGYNLLLPDSRDHGESGGDHVTYGLSEGEDAAAWVAWLKETYGENQKVILQGCDLGANAALAGAAAAERNPELAGSTLCVVAESPIDNLYEEAVYLMRSQFRIPEILIPLGDRFARNSLGGRSMKEISLTELTRECRVPVLLLEDTKDTVVLPMMEGEGFLSQYAGKVELLQMDCGYGMAYATDPSRVEAALDRLLDSVD